MLNSENEPSFDLPEELEKIAGESISREEKRPLSAEPVKVKVAKNPKSRRRITQEGDSENFTETIHTYITQDKAEILKVYCMVHKVSVSQFLRGLLESATGKMREGIKQKDIDFYRQYFGRRE
jgi:hypothetical protein